MSSEVLRALRGVALAAVAVVLVPWTAQACSVCLCGDNHAANLGLDTPVVGQWRLGLEQRVSSKSNGLEGGAIGTESSRDSRTTVMLSYSPSERASFGANLPFVDRRIEITGEPVTHTSVQLGDLELQARYDFRIRQTHGAFVATRVLGGVTAPTGSNNLAAEHPTVGHVGTAGLLALSPIADTVSFGGRADEHAQPGTGAWGALVGLAQLWSRPAHWFYGSLAYRALGTNSHGYKYGDSVLGTVEAGHRIGPVVAGVIGVAARDTKKDATGDDIEPLLEDSGGRVAFLTPGVQARVNEHWIAKAQVFVPVWSDLNGTQKEQTNLIARLTYTR